MGVRDHPNSPSVREDCVRLTASSEETEAKTWTLVACSGGACRMVETLSDAVCVVAVVGSQASDGVQPA